MEIFFVASLFVIVFIALAVVFVAKTEDNQDQEPQQPEVVASSTPTWDGGDIAMCYEVVGINMHDCALEHVGAFEGYIEAEPNNAFDPNAIKVMHRDGAHLGYIKAAETESVRQLFDGNLEYSWPVVGYVKHIIRPGSIWSDEKNMQQQLKENGYFVARIYVDKQTLCDFDNDA